MLVVVLVANLIIFVIEMHFSDCGVFLALRIGTSILLSFLHQKRVSHRVILI